MIYQKYWTWNGGENLMQTLSKHDKCFLDDSKEDLAMKNVIALSCFNFFIKIIKFLECMRDLLRYLKFIKKCIFNAQNNSIYIKNLSFWIKSITKNIPTPTCHYYIDLLILWL